MHFFFFYGCKETTTAKETSTVFVTHRITQRRLVRLEYQNVQYQNRSKSLQCIRRRMQTSTTTSFQLPFWSPLSCCFFLFFFSFLSLICDAFAQSELTPLNPDKCNNALYSSELLNARFGEVPCYHMEHYVVWNVQMWLQLLMSNFLLGHNLSVAQIVNFISSTSTDEQRRTHVKWGRLKHNTGLINWYHPVPKTYLTLITHYPCLKSYTLLETVELNVEVRNKSTSNSK